MTADDADILAAAARLSAAAGFGPPTALTPLAGGRNNRVFRIDYGGDRPLAALKRYFHSPADRRDRLGAEWALLTYAWQRGVCSVPRPLAAEPESHMALYAFVPGRKLQVGEIGAAEVAAAADFAIALNAAPRQFAGFAPGSEACFSLAEHLATVDRRIARLDGLDREAPHAAEAARFVAQALAPAWRHAGARILERARALGSAADAPIDAGAVCLSPSDFGFHNAIRRPDGELVFLDFEYAGRDDPAKLVCDFFCQPEVPVPLDHWGTFCRRIVEGLGLSADHGARFDLLLDAYRVKWICIILNDFVAADSARRSYASPADRAARCAAQLALAQSRLHHLTVGAL